MKHLFFLMNLLALTLSCGKENRPLSDEQVILNSDIIIGQDTRIPITNSIAPKIAKDYANRVGQLVMTNTEGKEYSCTASLIQKDYAITSAHCVIEQNGIMTRHHIQFAPNITNGPIGADIYDVEKIFVSKKYIQERRKNPFRQPTIEGWAHDIAILKLKLGRSSGRSVGDIYGWLRGKGKNIHEDNIDEGLIIGYPGDKPFGHKFYEFCSFSPASPQLHALANVYKTTCDVMGGQSGSPVFFQHTDGNYYLRGLVTGDIESLKMNLVTLLTDHDAAGIANILQGIHTDLQHFEVFNNIIVASLPMITFTNKCHTTIYVATLARRSYDENNLSVKYWWTIKPGETVNIHRLRDSEFYYYAATRENHYWYGDHHRDFGIRDMNGVGFQKVVIDPFSDSFEQNLTCN